MPRRPSGPRDRERSASTRPGQHPSQNLVRRTHGLGNDDIARLGCEGLRSTVNCLNVIEGERPDGFPLKVMASAARFDQTDHAVRRQNRDRKAREARARAEIRKGLEGRQHCEEGRSIQNQPPNDLLLTAVAGQVDPLCPLDQQSGERKEHVDLSRGGGEGQLRQPSAQELVQVIPMRLDGERSSWNPRSSTAAG